MIYTFFLEEKCKCKLEENPLGERAAGKLRKNYSALLLIDCIRTIAYISTSNTLTIRSLLKILPRRTHAVLRFVLMKDEVKPMSPVPEQSQFLLMSVPTFRLLQSKSPFYLDLQGQRSARRKCDDYNSGYNSINNEDQLSQKQVQDQMEKLNLFARHPLVKLDERIEEVMAAGIVKQSYLDELLLLYSARLPSILRDQRNSLDSLVLQIA